jgi:tetratricopeptide (TPR) repeat protein
VNSLRTWHRKILGAALLLVMLSAVSVDAEEQNMEEFIKSGDRYTEQKDYDKAIAEYNKAIEEAPASYWGYTNRGITRMYKKEYDLAISDLTKAISFHVSDATAYIKRSGIFAIKGKYQLALADLNKAERLDPQNAAVYSLRGAVHAASSQLVEALKDYGRAIELAPQNIDNYLSRGEIYFRQKNYEAAFADLNKAEKLEPTNKGIYMNRALIYNTKQEYQLAIDEYTKAIKLDPQDAAVYKQRVAAYLALGQLKLAKADCAKLMAGAHSYEGYYARSLINEKMGRHTEALADFKKAVALDSRSEQILLYLVSEQTSKNMFEYAVLLCDKLIALNPKQAEYYAERGYAEYESHKYTVAEADFNKAIELNPNEPNYFDGRGNVYGATGKYEAAVAEFRHCLELSKDYDGAYFNLAQSLELLGNKEEALIYYQLALEHKVADTAKAKTEARIKGDWESSKEWL